MSALRIRVRLARGEHVLDVDLETSSRVTSVFGKSGVGKTTLLRCVAGFERAPGARVSLGDTVWQDDATDVFVAPWRRGIGYVSQDPGLFAHRTVEGNLRYAYRRVPRGQRRVEIQDVLEWLDLGALRSRWAGSLSGGEKQRVALGRAVLTSPRLLLLDEPLAALDEGSRRQLMARIEDLPGRLDAPVVYVSHSLPEVARVCERMVWLVDGRVHREGPMVDLASSVDLAIAEGEAIGAVLVGTVVAHDDRDRLTELSVPGGSLFLSRLPRAVGTEVRVRIPARDVSLALDREERSSLLNVLDGVVASVDVLAPGKVAVRVVVGEAPRSAHVVSLITERSRRVLALEPGTRVFARVKSVGLL